MEYFKLGDLVLYQGKRFEINGITEDCNGSLFYNIYNFENEYFDIPEKALTKIYKAGEVRKWPGFEEGNFIVKIDTDKIYTLFGFESEIKSITNNEKKRIITVVFKDGDVQMAKAHPEEKDYSLEIGVSLCIARHEFGSRNKMLKYLEKAVKPVLKKEKKKCKK